MSQIKKVVVKLSHGLKSRLAILAVGIIFFALSSTFVFTGLYMYSKAHHTTKNDKPTITRVTSPNKVADSTTKKSSTTPAAKTTTNTSTQKATAPPAPVVVQAVAPAPSSSVESLAATSTPPTVVSDSSPPTANPIRVSSTTYTSTNWSGYLATGGNFTTVSGSWVVPSVTGATGIESGDGAWIGIGGVTSNDLIQVGTLDQVNPDGTIDYRIFYEVLPAAAMVVDAPVDAGDLITASITETALNQWMIVINDVTKGSTFSKSLSYTSTHSSAEWIEEDPSYLSGDLMPFANFGTINFSGCKSTVDTYLYNIADIGASSITMVARRAPIAVPSAISGSGFSVARYY